MIGSKIQKIEDILVTIVLEHPQSSTKELFALLKTKNKSITLQATHRIIKRLVDGGVLLKRDKGVFISQEWVNALRIFTLDNKSFHPNPGESFHYTFTSMAHEDAFWKHVFFQLYSAYPEEPVFIAVPHQIWVHTPERKESEGVFYSTFATEKRHTYYSIGGTTVEDTRIRNSLRSEYLHIELARLAPYPLTHVTVIGDIVVYTRLRKRDEQRIDTLYAKNLPHPLFLKEITQILHEIHHITFIVKNDRTEAQKIRKLIARDYHIPQEVVTRFSLW